MALSDYGETPNMTKGLPDTFFSQPHRISDRGYSNEPSPKFLGLCSDLEKELELNHQGAEIVSGSVSMNVGQELFAAAKSEKLKFRLPVDSDTVFSDLSTVRAKVGIKGEGNKVDPKIRSTEEADASRLPLAPLFKNCDFLTTTAAAATSDKSRTNHQDLKEASSSPSSAGESLVLKEHLRQQLCPTADSVKCVPYKLLFYNPGDFFDIHVDTMHHPDQFGSLSLEIPLLNNDFEWEEKPDQDFDRDSLSTEGRGGELVFYSTASRRPLTTTGDEEQSWDRKELRNIPRRNYSSEDNKYGRSDRVRRITRIQLTSDSPSEQELRKKTFLTGDILRGGRKVEGKIDDQGEEVKNAVIEAKYAAWLGDIPHEVRPVVKGLRLVLTYNLIKVGSRPLSIPRAPLLRRLTERIFEAMPRAGTDAGPLRESMFASGGTGGGGRGVTVEALGFQLKHAYTPGGFKARNLKGIDAIVYAALSKRFECHLQMGTEMKCELPDRCYVRYEAGKSKVQIAGLPGLSYSELQGTSLRDSILSKTTLGAVSGCAWIELGHGVLLGGGAIYGNADVGSDWWYRTCLMVVTKRPSRWSRRVPLFLIRERASEDDFPLVSALKIRELLQQIATFI